MIKKSLEENRKLALAMRRSEKRLNLLEGRSKRFIRKRYGEDANIDLVPQVMGAGGENHGDIVINFFWDKKHGERKNIGNIFVSKKAYEIIDEKQGIYRLVDKDLIEDIELQILDSLKKERLITDDIPFKYTGEFKVSGKKGAIELFVSKDRILVKKV